MARWKVEFVTLNLTDKTAEGIIQADNQGEEESLRSVRMSVRFKRRDNASVAACQAQTLTLVREALGELIDELRAPVQTD